MRTRRRLRKLVRWASLLATAVVGVGSFAAYHYATDSDTLADLIRREAPRYLPGCRVDVARARLRPFVGEVTLTQVHVREPGGPDSAGPTVASAPRVQVRFDPWALFKGRFEAREVTIARPTIRLRRLADGSWNVEGLLADPWPASQGGAIPPIAIQEGTVELSEGEGLEPLKVLQDVAIKVPASTGDGSPVAFELSAKGELFDRVRLEGTVDPATGRVALKPGELVRLNLSESLRDRLPAPLRDQLAPTGLAGGEVDATLSSLTFDPGATPRLHYKATARLRRGIWRCQKLPFAINDVSVDVEAEDGRIEVVRADGVDGSTGLSLRGKATIDPDDPARSPFEVHAEATNLELDSRLRKWIPASTHDLWDAYFPQVARTPTTSAGRINVAATVVRPEAGAKVGVEVDVECLDVSMEYKHFAYPVDHVKGHIHATADSMTLDVRTLVGNRPFRVTGTVKDPGPDAEARLNFDLESLPVDATLFRALPPDVRAVVDSFRPTGSVGGHAELVRLPPLGPGDDPRGRVTFDAWIDLNPGCSVTWDKLKYPVMDLSGKLEIHPKLWVFKDMKGKNGQATIFADGEVKQLRRDALKVDVCVRAENLPFDQQLRDSLPRPWRVTWTTLNPTGASDIKATIAVDPDLPEPRRQRDRVEITPRKQAGVKLRFNPLPGPNGLPSAPIEMRMDDVAGSFVYDTATTPMTTMTDVAFSFQGAPVTFARGVVDVRDDGQFELGVTRLEVSNLQLDAEARRYMPPVMAQFARKLDDRKIPKIKANLGLGWSGKAGESARCRWDDALVVLADNRVSIGTDLALDHIQGQLYPVQGSFDGRDLEVHGKLDIASIKVFDQQVTGLTADLDVQRGLAQLDHIAGKILDGTLDGRLRASLDATPHYSVGVSVKDADLRAFAMTQPGHQGAKGLVTAWVELSGTGYDPNAISGQGGAAIVHGDLGTLPVALRFFNVLKLSKETTRAATAFDSAKVAFKVDSGTTTLDPVQFTGNAFSLDGKGTLDIRGELNLGLKITPGRDTWKIPVFTDLIRALSSQIFQVRVLGPYATPSFKPEPIPGPGEFMRARKRNHEIRRTGLLTPWWDKTGRKPDGDN